MKKVFATVALLAATGLPMLLVLLLKGNFNKDIVALVIATTMH